MNRNLRVAFALCAVLYILCLFALLTGSRGYQKETPSYAGSVQKINQAQVLKDGDESAVTLPCSLSGLSARTPVTLLTEASVESGDCLYIKTVYAPLKVYADDTLIFTSGQKGSFPRFMADPPTESVVIPLDAFSETVQFRLEYLSPKTRGALSLQPLIIGKSADIFQYMEDAMGVPFVISLLQIALGLLLALIALPILLFEKKGIVFLYLGLSSLAVGLWCFAECDLTGLFLSNGTLLYLLSFISLYTIPIPLLLFATSMISFRRPLPLHVLCALDLSAAAAALLLQLLGIVNFSESVKFFHVLLPFSMLALAGYIVYEGIRNQNQAARRFFLPMAVLAVSAALEVANYSLRFTDVLSSIFQLGIVAFTLMTSVIGGLFVRDALRLKEQRQQLAFEVSLMEKQIEEQKKRQQMLLQNAEAVRMQRHDLRHQLTVIRSYSEKGGNEQLTDYLDTLLAEIPSEKKSIYCENPAVNAVVSHYAAVAEGKGITCSVRLVVPAQLEQFSDSSLSVIFGNLFENAIEACDRMTSEQKSEQKFIRLNSRLQYKTLTITMDNSFDGRVAKENGRLLSGKHGDFGIGTASIAAVAKRHGGEASFEADGTVFLSSVYLHL